MSQLQLADRVVAEARSWLGTPYRHQASIKGVGCDCLGLLRGIWRSVYGNEPQTIPPYSADWDIVEHKDVLFSAATQYLVPIDQFEVGAVLIFRWRAHLPAKHLAIQVGAGKIIHAYERAGVVETSLGTAWKNKVAGLFRFPTQQSEQGRTWQP